MRSRLIKRGLLALGTLLLFGLLLLAAMPLIASTQIVRDRIAFELSALSGYRVSMGRAPEITVWPTFGAHLEEVQLRKWGSGDGPPVMEAERVEIDMSPLAALRGEISFSRIKLVRPLLRMRASQTLQAAYEPAASPGGGRLMRSIETARGLVEADPTNPETSMLPQEVFGIIDFSEGRIAVSEQGHEEAAVTSLSGRISWAALNRAANLSATGIWRGESIAVEVTSSQPLILMAGGDAPLSLSFESAPASMTFEGIAGLSGQNYFSGKAGFSSPSLRRFLEWSQTEIAAGASIGSLSLSGTVLGASDRMKMENVEIDLNGIPGNGVLDLAFSGGLPVISGTLAFRRLDLRSFLATFTPVAGGTGQMDDPVDPELSHQVNMDLRLSAADATLGELQISDLAAAVQVKENLATLDISDATAFGGNVQAGLRIDRAGDGSLVEMRLYATDINAGNFVLATGVSRIIPQARASLALTAKGSGHDWNDVLSNAEGTLSASLGEGMVNGFDLAGFLERSADGEFFALSEVGEGSLAIRGAELKGKVERGVLRIHQMEARSDTRTISIDGIVPFLGRALALSGSVSEESDGQSPDTPDTFFFIGGGWDAPFVTPVLHFGDVQ